MKEITLHLPADLAARLEAVAARNNKPLESVIETAISQFLADDEPSDEEILEGLRLGMKQALSGNYRPADEVLAELNTPKNSH